jgi:hypothetical protein
MSLTTNSKSSRAIIDVDIQIQPQLQLRFERLLSHPRRGICLVDVLLRNNGNIAASYPFLCLTVFGLTVNPAQGWDQQEVTLVRKMRRFIPVGPAKLDPGAVIHCCTINLRYRFSCGGFLEFETGSEHPLRALPNFNLMCIVGAGNYPSRRIPLQVTATSLKAIIEEHIDHMEVSDIGHKLEMLSGFPPPLCR